MTDPAGKKSGRTQLNSTIPSVNCIYLTSVASRGCIVGRGRQAGRSVGQEFESQAGSGA